MQVRPHQTYCWAYFTLNFLLNSLNTIPILLIFTRLFIVLNQYCRNLTLYIIIGRTIVIRFYSTILGSAIETTELYCKILQVKECVKLYLKYAQRKSII